MNANGARFQLLLGTSASKRDLEPIGEPFAVLEDNDDISSRL